MRVKLSLGFSTLYIRGLLEILKVWQKFAKLFCFCILEFMADEKIFANALNQCLQLGPMRLKRLKEYFGNFERAWRAPFGEFKNVCGAKDLAEFRNKIDPEKEMAILEKAGIKIILEDGLPLLLKETPAPPQILYIKGSLPDESKIHLAVVGTRKCTSYGKEACEKIVSELKDYDAAIVSGMALGIDTIAHKTALKNKMKTIAVLGCGLSPAAVYPPSNRRFSEEIIEKGGCLISEYSYEMKAAYFTFPQRNRITAGISSGTLVVEAPERSGALITAFLALEYNREVFSVPGSIFSDNSSGTNKLLKIGALSVVKAEDILQALGIELKDAVSNLVLLPAEEKIISFLTEPIERDELMRMANLSPKEINPLLSQMEIRGIIKEASGKIYKI